MMSTCVFSREKKLSAHFLCRLDIKQEAQQRWPCREREEESCKRIPEKPTFPLVIDFAIGRVCVYIYIHSILLRLDNCSRHWMKTVDKLSSVLLFIFPLPFLPFPSCSFPTQFPKAPIPWTLLSLSQMSLSYIFSIKWNKLLPFLRSTFCLFKTP